MLRKLLSHKSTRSLYFENSIGRIWEEPGDSCGWNTVPARASLLQFRALLTHAAQALSRRHWEKMLVDQRAMAPFNASEQEWMATEWLPRAVAEHGYRYGAVLLAHDVFARLAMNQYVMASRQLHHVYRTFDTEETAVAWLLNPTKHLG
ncbi:hypothetical protein ACFQT0_02125 [Hymenobacter humi]|uniref:STAS/SEC14 domain-containing protein n=1 Tax=Hymenobacter humi TaxID=1411620 RepID=A0ABW2U1M6_9BACT